MPWRPPDSDPRGSRPARRSAGQPRGGLQSQHCRCRGLISVPVVPPRLPVRPSLAHSLTNRAGDPDTAPVEIAVVAELCAARRQAGRATATRRPMAGRPRRPAAGSGCQARPRQPRSPRDFRRSARVPLIALHRGSASRPRVSTAGCPVFGATPAPCQERCGCRRAGRGTAPARRGRQGERLRRPRLYGGSPRSRQPRTEGRPVRGPPTRPASRPGGRHRGRARRRRIRG